MSPFSCFSLRFRIGSIHSLPLTLSWQQEGHVTAGQEGKAEAWWAAGINREHITQSFTNLTANVRYGTSGPSPQTHPPPSLLTVTMATSLFLFFFSLAPRGTGWGNYQTTLHRPNTHANTHHANIFTVLIRFFCCLSKWIFSTQPALQMIHRKQK